MTPKEAKICSVKLAVCCGLALDVIEQVKKQS